ncbi:TPA: alpha/beta fold hydrolase [Pseudomonas aeruginosa]|uniref:alpha/beta fold hydrolase n=1 Tax=Pseudomonas aeruginosa TaxID=287 RepID=UPI001069EE8D|nr:alpha/beta hydrolase [Pseudomonas aeruginosa]HBP5039058.1 alpha/beta fold hydrolase [Pseudomonas aeruginosa]HCG0885656.1 alpha/beta fold hydrolase [Pseudomonas aeruginosa]
MPSVSRGDIELVFDIQGQGPDLLLIAGTASDRSLWAQVRSELSRHFRTIAFDNRDAGQSSICSGAYTLQDLAEDARTVLSAAGAAQAHVMGHSLGGMIVQELALLAPERVASLTLVDTTSRLGTYMQAVISMALDWCHAIEDRELLVRSLYFLALGEEAIHNDALGQIAASLADGAPGQPKEALIRQWEVDLTVDTYDRLEQIRVPTHVVWGVQDKIIPEVHQFELLDKIVGSKYTRLKHSGHCPMIETPVAFTEKVLQFFHEQ